MSIGMKGAARGHLKVEGSGLSRKGLREQSFWPCLSPILSSHECGAIVSAKEAYMQAKEACERRVSSLGATSQHLFSFPPSQHHMPHIE